MKSIGVREARQLAFANAAALIDNFDLEAFYGEDYIDTDDVVLTDAQRYVVAYIRKKLQPREGVK